MKALSSGRIPDGVIIPEGKLLVAFSGGSDSLFLLSVLSEAAGDRTEAVYVNHHLRPETELREEIELNIENAELLHIPLTIINIPEGEITKLAKEKDCGVEAAAREVRYRLLREKADNEHFDWILTAHHREDQAETVLMRILSGSPFTSYQGIRREDGKIFRPLLSVPKSEIMDYLQLRKLEYSEDSTNSDTDYLRNDIRHNIMPLISDTERDILSRIAENTEAFRNRIPTIKITDRYFYKTLDRNEFIGAFPFQKEEAVYSVLSSFGEKSRVPRSLIDDICKKAEEGKGRIIISSAVFFFTSDEIRIYPSISDFVTLFENDEARYRNILLGVTPHHDTLTLRIDTSKLVPPVILRTSREGDRIILKDGERKISDMEKNLRIPYSLVLEDRSGIKAFFSRFLGGRDRLSLDMLGEDENPEYFSVRSLSR